MNPTRRCLLCVAAAAVLLISSAGQVAASAGPQKPATQPAPAAASSAPASSALDPSLLNDPECRALVEASALQHPGTQLATNDLAAQCEHLRAVAEAKKMAAQEAHNVAMRAAREQSQRKPAQTSGSGQAFPNSAATANISGNVTDAGATGISGIGVRACSIDSYSCTSWSTSETLGAFSVAVPQSDSYKLQFEDPDGTTYLDGYYESGATGNFTLSFGDASAIAVATSDVTGIDVAMPTGVHISGTVTGPPHYGFPYGVDLWACSTSTSFCEQGWSDGGSYVVAVPQSDSYILEFADPSGILMDGFYDSAGSGNFTPFYDDAEGIAVGTGDVTGIDVVMPAPVHISGTVSHAPSGALSGVDVYACEVSSSGGCFYTSTDATGAYSAAVLPNDTYTLYVDDRSGTYCSGYYSSSASGHWTANPSAATQIAVTTGNVSGVNITLPLPAHITGRVTSSVGTGLTGIDVMACVIPNGSGCFFATSASGNYSVPVTPGLSYILILRDSNGVYVSGCYSSTASGHFTVDSGAASEIAVANSDRTGINVTLPTAAHIRGTVIDSGAVELSGIAVYACSTLWCFFAQSASDGTYSVPVLRSGSYTLEFRDDSGTYLDGYYDSGATGDFTLHGWDASNVPVASVDVTGIDVVMPTAAHISGTVTDGTDALPQVWVFACSTTTCDRIWQSVTAADGTYDLSVPQSDSYSVSFVDSSGTHVSGYYESGATDNFTADLTAATAVDVSGGDQTGIDVALRAAVNISGRATNANSNSVPGLVVWACESGTTECFNTYTDTGSYSIPVLPGHDYVVEFDDVSFPTFYQSGFYDTGATGNFTTDQASATAVPVTTANVADVSVVLPLIPGGTYYAVTPYRVLDSRVPKGVPSKFHSRVKQTVLIADGSSGVPVDATAVTGNVTVVSQTNNGFVTVAPSLTGGTQPSTSTINFPVGDIRANGVTVPLADGNLDFMYWSSSTSDTVQIIFDVTGFFRGGASYNGTDGSTYYTVAPYRVLDSRIPRGVPATFHSRVKQTVLIATTASQVPTDATAVTGNLTIVSQTKQGFVTVAPSLTSGTQPSTSTLNFPVGDIRANNITVPLAAGGNLDFMYWSSSTSDTAQVIFDVTGYFEQNLGGATYHAVSPYRVMDSRTPKGVPSKFHSRVRQTVLISTYAAGVPTAATAVTGNVTIVSQTGGGYVTVAPSLTSGTQPSTSTLNFPVGDIRANGIDAPLKSGLTLDFMYWTGSTADTVQIIFDVTGYFG